MSDVKSKYWKSIQLYKGYLPMKEGLAAQSYVILASKAVRSTSSTSVSVKSACDSFSHRATGNSPDVPGSGEEFDSSEGGVQSKPNGSEEVRLVDDSDGVSFYIFLKRDVTPPPVKYTISPKQVNSCFAMCEMENCSCGCLHVRPGAWRLRADTLHRVAIHVSEKVENRRLRQEDISPTAGFFFALGLKHLKVVQAVVPVMCRFNQFCKHGACCLYIHANVNKVDRVPQAADVPLRTWAAHSVSLSEEGRRGFFDFLDRKNVTTVGDLQVLGLPAFELLASKVPCAWAEAFLIVSTLRNLDRKSALAEVLDTFPRIHSPVKLPAEMCTVGALLDTPSLNFYRMDILPHVMNACEIIRSRYEMDEDYNVITLNKEPADSFFVKVTKIIEDFRGIHAHVSWRKHDPARPIVTSVFTYVDTTKCTCRGPGGRPVTSPFINEMNFPPVPSISCKTEVGIPRGSWCQCPRYWEIAVNYELSTPSGSRCSEQNVMGRLAAGGVPTWALRDIFVHGSNKTKEVNPLFPCGVCENMLQKVDKDVMAEYGGGITLYMFDATNARKVVCLPVPEISHRNGSGFKKFVAQDLREH